jgi:hypothetical protein
MHTAMCGGQERGRLGGGSCQIRAGVGQEEHPPKCRDTRERETGGRTKPELQLVTFLDLWRCSLFHDQLGMLQCKEVVKDLTSVPFNSPHRNERTSIPLDPSGQWQLQIQCGSLHRPSSQETTLVGKETFHKNGIQSSRMLAEYCHPK